MNTSPELPSRSLDPLPKPMSVGEIIKAGWQSYTANFVRNFVIALKGLLWSIAPVVVALVAIRVFIQQVLGELSTIDAEAIRPYLGPLVLAIAALAVFSLYCLAQSLGHLLGISRLAFQSLNAEPESEKVALRFTRSRKFSMLKAALLQSLIVFVAYFAVISTLTLLAIIAANLFNIDAANPSPNVALYLLIGLLGAISIIVAICALIWLVLRLMLIPQPLALEQNASAVRSVTRSWQLSRKNAGRILLVTLLYLLISLPISIVTYIVSNTVVLSLFGSQASIPGDSPESVTTFITATLVNLLLSTLGSLIVTPFWYTTLAALYFDLRNRLTQSITAKDKILVSNS